jgi:hypothetical protein
LINQNQTSGAAKIAASRQINYVGNMSAKDIAAAVMELAEAERLELARRIVASISAEREISRKVADAVRGIEDIVTGKLSGLNESEFRNALK